MGYEFEQVVKLLDEIADLVRVVEEGNFKNLSEAGTRFGIATHELETVESYSENFDIETIEKVRNSADELRIKLIENINEKQGQFDPNDYLLNKASRIGNVVVSLGYILSGNSPSNSTKVSD